MHRSGTSALTRLLGSLGAALPRDPLPPKADNKAGFWESRAVVEVDNRLLRACRSSWVDPRPLRLDLLNEDQREGFIRAMQEAVTAGWGEAPLIAMKDPRQCRFVPMIAEALSGMGIETRAVLVLRAPGEVAQSLEKRNRMGASLAHLLWFRHFTEAEQATRHMPREVVQYDELLADWRATLPRLARLFGTPGFVLSPRTEEEIDGLIDPALKHHGEAPPVSLLKPLPAMIDGVWPALCRLSASDDMEARKELDRACRMMPKAPWLDGDIVVRELNQQVGSSAAAKDAKTTTAAAEDRLRPIGGKAPRGLRVHVIAPHNALGLQASTYIRLLAPLTDPILDGLLEVSTAAHDAPLPPCDLCIVQRTAVPTLEGAEALVEAAAARSVPLVADVDDAFGLMGDLHPRAAATEPLIAPLDRIVGAACETWVATSSLAEFYNPVARSVLVVRNAIDPRLWRRWRPPEASPPTDGRLRLLYMGSHTHGRDFELVRPALDAIWRRRPESFALTLVGIAKSVDPAPWLTHLLPGAEFRPYPRFVPWLRELGPFDVGLAPLVDTPFNRAKSDLKQLEYAALGALPLVSDLPPYQADPSAGAVLVQDWEAAIATVLENRPAASDQAARAQRHVWANRTVTDIATLLMERIHALVAKGS